MAAVFDVCQKSVLRETMLQHAVRHARRRAGLAAQCQVLSQPISEQLQGPSCSDALSEDSHCRSLSTSAAASAPGAVSNTPGLLDALAMVFSPAQLGAASLEVVHSSTGLPWWVSIPVTAVAARGLLLPLSLKARQASGNVLLLNKAFSQAKLLSLDLSRDDTEALQKQRVIRSMFALLRDQSKLPSLRWYWANALVQSAVFGTMVSGLGAMSAAVWPGFATGGPPGLRDLSSPPVFLGTLSTPFGTMGAVVPLAIVLAYIRTVDAAPIASVPGISVAFRLLAAPLYCLTLIQPHAVLFYTAAHTFTCAALQTLPGPSTPGVGPKQSSSTTQLDVPLLLALGQHYASEPQTPERTRAAMVCYTRALRELQGEVAAAQALQDVPAGPADAQASVASPALQQGGSQGPATAGGVSTAQDGDLKAAETRADAEDDLDEVVPASVDKGLLVKVEMIAIAQKALDELEDRAESAGLSAQTKTPV